MDVVRQEALADRVLAKIRSKPGHPFSSVKLARLFKLSEEDLASTLGLLTDWGYKIKADRKGQYTFVSAPDSYLAAEISNKLKTKIIGKRIYAYKSVQSTNTIAIQLASSGAPEGTLVIAEHQTKGRGRLGRSWYSPEKIGLYCSVILKPKFHPTLAPGMSLITAVAVADTIASYGDVEVKIKWPNDVLISGRKTAGILTELSAEIDRTNFIIVGVGANINHKRTDLPEELRKTATSVRIGLNKTIRRVEFLQRFLLNLENEYLVFKRRGLEKCRKKILKYSSLISTDVKLKIGRRTISGNVLDIDRYGRLVVETSGEIKAFNAGEVTTH